ncbi:hypothetical protein CYLTODRAFT_358659 [Cylindrobasidium torrendii FP15055 ss-10]|uniref:Xylanolytic transcriptional activator regulatory domain-containing protein n=1 Tax=Cylindrobasidium torrendii FP15055 ss-10 TaxID=1314674 RepID=A0A0D7B298_9AGAR|nr:hypothetical protein CYLTODRAFT_358659 [Cylindrobasidium torrendii FP15055 ss-10]
MEQFDAAADLPYIFPDQDLLRHLIDVYFEEESTIAPLLYRPTFEARLSCHLHEYDRSFGALVLAVAAIASRYCNDDPRVLLDPTAKTSAGWHWYRQIRPIPSAFSSPPNLHNVQTYVLCSFYASATNAPPEYTWALPAFGIRMAQAVGAHRAKLGTQPSPEQEEWKRAFWALYCVDIFIAVATGRPMAMGVDDFDVQPPLGVDEAYWELPDPRLVFVQPDGVPSSNACWTHICSILDIMGFAHQTIYAPRRSRLSKELSVPDWDKRTIGAIDNALNEWVDAIPDHLRWNPHNPNELFLRQSVSLYTTFYFVNIIVHRPFIASRVGTSPVSINWPSLAICVNAARACCHVVDMYHRRGFPPMFSVQIMVFYAATVLIMNVWRNKALGNDEQVNKDLQDVHICMGALRISEKRWQNSGRLVDLITAMLSDLENVPTQSPTHPNTQKRTFDSAYLDEENWTFDTMPPTLDGPGFDDLFGPLPIHTADLERPLAADMPEERDADYTSWFAQRFASDFVRADWSSDEAFAMGSGMSTASIVEHNADMNAETRYYAENNERLRTMDDTRLEDQWIGVEIDPRDG